MARRFRGLLLVPTLGVVACANVLGVADYQNGEGADASLADASLADAAVDQGTEVATDSGSEDTTVLDAADTSPTDTLVGDSSPADTLVVDASTADSFVVDTALDSGPSDTATCVGGGACTTNPSACRAGKVDCATGSPVCVDDAPKALGTSCSGGVCNGGGTCNPCVAGSSCGTNPNACKSGKTDCATGAAVCLDDAPKSAGAACAGGVCNGAGACSACAAGTACTTNLNACKTGKIDCGGGVALCVDDAPKSAGTACSGGVCNGAGTCNPCSSGSGCATNPTACKTGKVDCASGGPVCVDDTAKAAGSACSGGVCNGSGACNACSSGAVCTTNPTACKTGKIGCTTGTSVCADDAPKAAGAACSGGVCNGAGTCNACSAGAACTTNPSVCKTGKTDCSTGFPACVDDTPKASGTACADGACDGAGTCKCVEGSKRCKAGTTNTPQTCTGGAWVDGAMCSGGTPTCSAGACSAVATPLSCAVSGPGRTDCGGGSESCCTSLLVTGVTTASFSRSYDGVTTGYTDPQYKAQVSDFRLDKYEITVGRFRQYVAAVVGGWKPTAGTGKHMHLSGGGGLNGGTEPGWDAAWNTSTNFPTASATWDTNLNCSSGYPTWTSTSGVNEKKPINCINWYDAAAFCIWDGGFLPSEAEWNYSAAGGTDQRKYPWGPTDPGPNATLAIYNCYYGGTGPGTCSGVANIAPVGTATAGNGKFGHSDLAGNVWEWTLDWYKSPYNETTCINCAYTAAGSTRVFRGGSFSLTASNLLAGYRNPFYAPTTRGYSVGARCARTP